MTLLLLLLAGESRSTITGDEAAAADVTAAAVCEGEDEIDGLEAKAIVDLSRVGATVYVRCNKCVGEELGDDDPLDTGEDATTGGVGVYEIATGDDATAAAGDTDAAALLCTLYC